MTRHDVPTPDHPTSDVSCGSATDPALDAPDAALAAAVARDPATDPALDAPDAALAAAVADDGTAPYDLDGLAAAVGTTRALLEAVERAGLLLPHHVDAEGTARYSAADADAVRSGLTLLDAGLPLGELLELARRTDIAVTQVAGPAVDAFLRFVRDPVRGTSGSDDEATERLVTAYQRMLPATEHLVAHHLRRRLLAAAAERVADEGQPAEHVAEGVEPAERVTGGAEPAEHVAGEVEPDHRTTQVDTPPDASTPAEERR